MANSTFKELGRIDCWLKSSQIKNNIVHFIWGPDLSEVAGRP